ncbi:MAG: hypothetical protein AAFP82_21805, partial [Bacteroidota bacterium]
YFTDSELHKVDVRGNAESVYYALDENDAYVGSNKTQSASMLIFFENSEVVKIKFYKQPTAKLNPMESTDHEALKLTGFKWVTEGRPRSIEDLLIVKPKRPRPIAKPSIPLQEEEKNDQESVEESIESGSVEKDKKQ